MYWTGRPPYDPRDLLKLYIYGYFNKIRSSRKLMAECGRNIELFFLLNRLTPDFRTIADFRAEYLSQMDNEDKSEPAIPTSEQIKAATLLLNMKSLITILIKGFSNR